MKNYIQSICWLIIFWVGAVFNITAQKTFKVYNNDGSMGVFFYSALDSITFTASNELDGSLIQNIHTPDSTYSFRTCDIDSVSFCSVPTIFKPNVIQIEGTLRNYVVGSESLTLLLKTTVPKSLLPKVGDNVATLECDDVLPNGFIGKVEDIVFGTDNIRVVCGKASLLDVFESLSIEESFTSEETNEEVNTRSPLDVWPPRHFNLVIPSIRGEISLSHDNDASNFSSTYEMTSYSEFSTEKCNINFAFLITPLPFQTPQVYMSLSYYAENTFTMGASFCASFGWDKEMSLLPIHKIKLPGPVAAILDLYLDGGAYLGVGGEVGIESRISKPYSTMLRYVYDNKADAALPSTFKMIGKKPDGGMTIEGDANISIGLYGKIGVSPILDGIAEVEADFKTGVTFSASSKLPVDFPDIDVINTKVYDSLDRDDYIKGDFFLTGEFTAEVLDSLVWESEIEIGDLIAENPVFTKGIVPHFSKVGLMKGENVNSLNATAQVSRNLMFGTNVGLALYDEENHLVDKWWSPIEYKDNEGEVISCSFEGLTPEASYKVHPITRLFKDNLVANPSSDCNLKPYINTGEAKNITSTQARLCAQIEVEDDVEYIAGFYYCCGDGERMEISSIGHGSQSLELTVAELSEEAEYTYFAFIKIGDYIEYGEESTFKTLGIGSGVEITSASYLCDISSSSVDICYSIDINCPGQAMYFGLYYCEDGGEKQFVDEIKLLRSITVSYGPSGLKSNTQYTCVAYMKVDDMIIYAEPVVIRTLRIDDEENPLFKCVQEKVSSSSNYISTIHRFEKAAGGDSGNYIIDPNGCTKRYKDSFSGCRELEVGGKIKEDWSSRKGQDSYKDYVSTGRIWLIVKYALATDPDEWYFTKVPIDMLYDTPPALLSYRAVGCGIGLKLQGSYWISNIGVEAELWDSIERKGDDGSSWVENVKIEERTFELSPPDFRLNGWTDGYENDAELYPKGSTNCRSPYVIIKNVTLVPKQ